MAAWKCFLGVLWHTRGISAQEPCAMKKYGHGVTQVGAGDAQCGAPRPVSQGNDLTSGQ